MNRLCRLYLPLIVAFFVTGCSSIHNSIGPDRAESELRDSVEAPVELAGGESPFCAKPEMEIPVTPELVRAPEPFKVNLYFLLDKVEFTPESQVESKKVYKEIIDRDFSEIIIVGHTDTAASNAYNDALSQRRAERVQQDLINMGVPRDVIRISSEGEYRLLIATPDETVEVRNRRVEINAR
ncbi:OmpA family protein [Methylophaga sp. OBS4]|uniref:OmpA family protein n=1 Tax=Methylophaga sp. OBS4 TaxID=2991935 RepID=UPI002259D002|nr:OmpA family protein [Methylophaga sp. OBS4]MCX4187498.1 OmpA family protein [Methylophaga sp. OBS4]